MKQICRTKVLSAVPRFVYIRKKASDTVAKRMLLSKTGTKPVQLLGAFSCDRFMLPCLAVNGEALSINPRTLLNMRGAMLSAPSFLNNE